MAYLTLSNGSIFEGRRIQLLMRRDDQEEKTPVFRVDDSIFTNRVGGWLVEAAVSEPKPMG